MSACPLSSTSLRPSPGNTLSDSHHVICVVDRDLCSHRKSFFIPCVLIFRKYQVAFCYTVIEKNNRQMLPVIRSSSGGDSVATNTNPLDSFFPFDPYLLKRYGRPAPLVVFVLKILPCKVVFIYNLYWYYYFY